VTPRNLILEGDALTVLQTLASASVECVITSPPYFRARDYQVAGQLGQEADVDAWVANLRMVVREIARVLVPTGSFWLNVGDSYSNHARLGAPAKSLLLAPERLIRALADDRWCVRNKVAWAKTNGLPSPVTDRLTNTWEPIFHLTKQPNYFYDLDAIRVPLTSAHRPGSTKATPAAVLGELAGTRVGLQRLAREGRKGHVLGKNPGDVWHLPTGRRRGSHFATFPDALARRPILATAPRRVCIACGSPWRRSRRAVRFLEGVPQARPFVPCGCDAPTRPGLVLDPFVGSGTTCRVAAELGRDWLGIELNAEFAGLARQRVMEAA
jgi:site-specific DNA-methyltransferase (adenine-specific)